MHVDASFYSQTKIGKETRVNPQLNYMDVLFAVTYCEVVPTWQIRLKGDSAHAADLACRDHMTIMRIWLDCNRSH